MSDASVSDRLNDLEVRLTFVDDTVTGLADADAVQSRRLLMLEQAVHDLRTELASIRVAMGHDPRNEPPPPHY
ncbi:MAG TPA: SlyX family protein [Rhodanobacteraceae bacterium]